MTLERQLEILKNARGHLQKGWIPFHLWGMSDSRYGNGPVCAQGAIYRATSAEEASIGDFPEGVHNRMCDASAVLFPEYGYSVFPYVDINNFCGQAAVLRVFDRAIAQLESELPVRIPDVIPAVEREAVLV